MTIGGDGTLLRAGLSCMRHGKPVLGVNLGRMGFLATCEVAELPTKLQRLAAEEFTLVNRGLLHAEVPAHGWRADAINDIVLFGQTRLHPMDYKVYCDGAFVGSYPQRRHDTGNANRLHRVFVFRRRADLGCFRRCDGLNTGLRPQCLRGTACFCRQPSA